MNTTNTTKATATATATATKNIKPAGVPLKKTAKAVGTGSGVARSEDDSAMDDIMRSFAQAQARMLAFFKVPTWKRVLCTAITYIAGVVGVTWLTSTFVGWLITGAIAASVPMFIAIIAGVLTAVFAAYYGHKLVVRVCGAILTKEADEKAVAAYGAMKNMFARLNPFVKMVPIDEAE